MAMTPVRRSRRAVVIGIVLLILFGSNFIANFYTDFLWFQEVGLTTVLWKSLGTQWAVGLVSGILVALLIWINLAIAARVSPVYRGPRVEVAGLVDPIARYRESLAPYVRLLRVAVALFFGLLTGLVASTRWTTFLLYLNRGSFGETDPQFGKDVGFYVFELPFFNFVAGEVWSALAAALFVSAVAHFFFGSIRPQLGLRGVTSGALAHLSVLLGLLALVKTAQYWLGRYELNFSTRGVVDGASYTDVNAQLPALNLLVLISIVSALLFLANIRFRRLSLPLAAVGIWILTSFLAGGVWPWAVQRFSVEPQELPRERPYIERNIEATQEAFGLGQVETRPFAANDALDRAQLDENQTLLQNVRVWDPAILQQAYQQLQAIRPYYDFPDVDIDRYVIDGEPRQILLSARELSLENLEERSQTWANLHLQYTHGYGLVASLANAATTAGQPSFIVQGVPGNVSEGAEELAADQARIYYGEEFEPDQYSVVRSDQQEIDYPTDQGPQRSRYEGEGGVPIGGFLKKLAFAVRQSDTNLILSSLINDDSRIIFYRNVFDRVLRAAPFLSLDNDPYVANVDGRLVWILDGYTATPWYPYSERFDAGTVLGTATEGRLRGDVNYIRNSVKIVVDAYDGTMQFYVIDEDDALIQAWRKAFPALFAEEEPSAELQAHFRYPEDLFKLQSEVFTTYHINDPNDFYSKEDVWQIPSEQLEVAEGLTGAQPIGGESALIDPTYLLIRLPQEPEAEFLLARPFTPRARNNMISFMVGRSDPGKYGELVILQFPRQKLVEGPSQIDNLINQEVEVSRTLTLLGQEGSDVSFGSLIILPIEESILYVRPLFVTADTLGIPELKRVLLVFGEQVVMADNFEDGIAELFGGEAPTEPERPEEPARPGPGEEPAPTGELNQLIREAAALYERAQEALADGDFEEYGRLIEELGRLLSEAEGRSS